jgi:hypothetical protein
MCNFKVIRFISQNPDDPYASARLPLQRMELADMERIIRQRRGELQALEEDRRAGRRRPAAPATTNTTPPLTGGSSSFGAVLRGALATALIDWPSHVASAGHQRQAELAQAESHRRHQQAMAASSYYQEGRELA